MRNSSTESVLSAAELPPLTSVLDQVASPLFSVGRMLRIARRGSLPLGIFLLVWTAPAFGHRDDYLNETFVFQTIERGEFEPELWIDAGRGRERSGGFRAYAAAFEYGITDHWMVDSFAGWIDPIEGSGFLQRIRAETRVRFGEEGDRPVDVAASFEVEHEREQDVGEEVSRKIARLRGLWILTPRLVLSRDLGGWNLTLNLDAAREFPAGGRDRWTSGYALGARYPREAFLRYGVELRQDWGSQPTSLLMPQVWLSLAHEMTVKVGAGARFEGSPHERFLRIVFEREF